ncbi:lysoplasmalogenase [Gordonia sp. TBRC 11910]|uniref:Lysoplasmalogenase n=1 Tax=Gordonia asplenii TaxID=2725283 RepID=A0A848L0A6_9ACTN|nr:lysoplasmalogenase [Gordonia asplenii]NMO02073.1 lysoplasmalogenase [Gordonia asplenii]
MSLLSRLSENHKARQRLWWAAYGTASAAATVTGALGNRSAAAATKPIPLVLLGIRVIEHPYLTKLDRVLIGGAVVASAIGDVWMYREEFAVDPAAKDRNLQLGAASFGVAQGFYSASMIRRGGRFTVASLAPRLAVMGEPAAVLTKFSPRVLPVLSPYGSALATMSALASTTGSRRLTMGGIAFQASDIAIINRRHLLSDVPRNALARKVAEGWVLGSYFAAQLLLVDGLLRPDPKADY